MQVSIETLSGLQRRITVHVAEDILRSEEKDRLKTMARETRINGFRPGKTPVSLIRRRYGTKVREEVVAKFLQSSFEEAVQEKNLHVVGGFTVDSVKQEDGLEYIATFEIKPIFELSTLAGETVDRPSVKIVKEDVDAMVRQVRSQHSNWEVVDRGIEIQDQVRLHLKGFVAGDMVPELDREAQFVLGEGQVLPGLNQHLQGAKKGEHRSCSLEIPEKYQVKNIAGKTVDCEIDILQVEQAVLPELDTHFIKAMGISSGNSDDFRQEILATMKVQLQQAIENNLKAQVVNILVRLHPFELPNSLVNQEMEGLKTKTSLSMVGKVDAQFISTLPQEPFEENAKRSVHFGLLMLEIVEKNSIQVDEERVKAHIQRAASSYEDATEAAQNFVKDEKELKKFRSMALEDQVVDWAMDQVQVREKEQSFAKLTGLNQKYYTQDQLSQKDLT